MQPIRITFVIATALMLAAPISSAAWSAMGGIEPDNKYEGDGVFNYVDAPGSESKRIYFQAFTSEFGFNPNVGAAGTLETHIEPTTIESVYALLGVWRDCNGDGYIGLAESAALEYPATLLSSTTICPAESGQANQFAAKDYPSNYNGWVTEFIHIGGNGSDPADDVRDARIIRDNGAMIWGDFGLPDDGVDAAGGTCAVRPLPRGTIASTGGALNYVDCNVGVMEQWNALLGGRTVAGQPVPGADPDNTLGLRFQNDDDANVGGHPLDVETFGSEDSSGAAVSITDCSATLFDSGETINESGVEDVQPIDPSADNFTIYAPNPAPTGTANPTIPGQVNETNEDFDDCDTSNDRGDDFYGTVEGDFAGSVQGAHGKEQAEWNFGFNDFNRGETGWAQVAPGNTGASGFFGAFRLTGLAFFAGPIWDTNVALIKAGQNTVRTNLAAGTVEPADPWIETYYAFVGSNTTSKGFQLPSGGATRAYGFEQCGGVFGPGREFADTDGWECDPTAWYMNADGTAMPEPTNTAKNARVGQAYQLRDIDCYDGNAKVAGSGVPLGVPAVGANPCN